MKSRKRKPGFTLVELLVVMTIIGLLMGLVIGIAGAVNRGAAESQAKAQIADLMNEIEKFKSENGVYPDDWNDFGQWYDDKYQIVEGGETIDMAYTITEGTPSDPLDPWGQDYIYDFPYATDPAQSPFVYLIGSKGPDARWGSQDDPNNQTSFGLGDDITNRNGALN